MAWLNVVEMDKATLRGHLPTSRVEIEANQISSIKRWVTQPQVGHSVGMKTSSQLKNFSNLIHGRSKAIRYYNATLREVKNTISITKLLYLGNL